MSEPKVKIGVVTVSDRAYKGEYEDKGGPAVIEELKRLLITPFEPIARIVPDEWPLVEAALKELVDEQKCAVVVTTGGTGPAPRDVTVDATLAVIEKELPGFGEAMRKVSLEKVPTAILSRQTAGVRGATLIINLPGKPSAISECLGAVFSAVPDCVDLIGGPDLETNPDTVSAYRPHVGHKK